MRRAALVLVLAMLPVAVAPAFACDPPPLGTGQQVVQSARFAIAWRARPAPIAVSEPFALEMSICAEPGAPQPEGLAVDATMPAHRHGMNYRPTVIDGPDGRFLAEGMVFHMPGTWRLVFDVRAPGGSERLIQDVTVE